MEQKITYGIIGLIALLTGFGGSMLLSQDTIDHTYVCNVTEQIATFTRLSSTMKTGYYTDPANSYDVATNKTIELSKTCTNGKWIKLADYAKSKGVDPINFLMQNQQASTSNDAPAEDCYPVDENKGCIRRT